MRTAPLLDSSTLIALVLEEHEHHDSAMRWARGVRRFAVCPIVEGALVRTLLRLGETAASSAAALGALRARPATDFWPDAISYTEVDLHDVRGHRQVTDAYLVALATDRGSRLATFDRGLAAAHPAGTILLEG